ncbi:hypothetical protein F503_01582 [Ophiostoma piceae UAMH 11346]|uniref:Rrp15p-domain-containing protein n=1 Tax=Ophiostoma piceae (strain UAMH 11346) TaxID=1262450 RepID=S3BTU7_OPHP1|nr:hypothetical protein F503_01582 [Ophiostoma piceae UAMH 11346]
MAGITATRKRRGDDIERASAKRAAKAAKNGDRFKRKMKRQQYNSDSDDDEEQKSTAKPVKVKATSEATAEATSDDDDDEFTAVDLLDSDNEALDGDALVDDGASDDGNDSDDSLDSSPAASILPKKQIVSDAPADSDDNQSSADDDELDLSDDEDGSGKPKSKRNDPNTFATSLQKILGTKLSTTRRADPVLARSADARDASRRVLDAALEEKARRQMRIERRTALDKGRVKDVLIASNRPIGGGETSETDGAETETTASILATEKKLRKVAQRGVVQLFNAVRAAQVKATKAKKQTRTDGVIGMDKREAKVTEMSRKGFLDLIASGGGGLKKGGLEEA